MSYERVIKNVIMLKQLLSNRIFVYTCKYKKQIYGSRDLIKGSPTMSTTSAQYNEVQTGGVDGILGRIGI